MSSEEIIDKIKKNKKIKYIDEITNKYEFDDLVLKEINKIASESPLNIKEKDIEYIFDMLNYLESPSSMSEKEKIIKNLSVILEHCKKRIEKISNTKKNKNNYTINTLKDKMTETIQKLDKLEVKDMKSIVYYNFFNYLIYETRNFFQAIDTLKICNQEYKLVNEKNELLLNKLIDTYLYELLKKDNKENILYYEKIIKYFLDSPNFSVDRSDKATIIYKLNTYVTDIKNRIYNEDQKKLIIFHVNELLGFMLGNNKKLEIQNELYNITEEATDEDLIEIHPIVEKLQEVINNDENYEFIDDGSNSILMGEIYKLKINKALRGKIRDIAEKVFGYIYEENKNNNYKKHLDYKYNIIKNEDKESDNRIETHSEIDYYNYTDKFVITIDGNETSVFDDAISLEKIPNGNTILGVYLADAAASVKKGSEIDKNALTLSETIYVRNSSHLMLPDSITNNLSLNDQGKKRTIGYFFVFDNKMQCIDFQVRRCLIKVSANLNYAQADKYLMENNIKDELSIIKDMLNISNIISSKHKFNNNVIDCMEVKDEVSAKLIANIMVYTNFKIAQYFNNNKSIPFIYRNNIFSIDDKFKRDISKITRSDFEIKEMIDQMCSNISSCFYSIDNQGHYNLNLEAYCQATNPIRNYASLEIQRIVERYIIDKKTFEPSIKETKRIKDICEYLNKRMDLNREYIEEAKKVKILTK